MTRRGRLLAIALAAIAGSLGGCGREEAGSRAEVIHWWTSGGESAAVQVLADDYRKAGGVWVDSAVASGKQL